MIVVLQTVDTTLARIRSLVGERGSVCYFGGHREALTHIRTREFVRRLGRRSTE
ncbi:MAG: hypothetical protein UY76_C0010G0010 [Candidatus Uhrbacteria bacterium GW2011_GWA2_52_8d]|uniref:Uncharacterized protein n=1 Tax=Candidatus Uhrbacteria bacterium GW2011_GWA2_52_8d TaxID=1618979 RepID=A0A0G1XP49_9BACT|nr:MAG: hypothetical protein UY76_C0010G0010 [Candidatus Uhrbacteria bacterium GW2011_GWA2_52_8d]